MTRPPYEGNKTQNAGEKLAEELRPQEPKAAALLNPIHDVGVVRASSEPPTDRYVRGFGPGDDDFRMQVQALVERGVIADGVLVLADTGHDIPMLAQLAQKLDMQGAIIAPEKLGADDGLVDGERLGNGSRVQSQAQTFGEDIQRAMRHNAQDGTTKSLFIGLEGHRKYALSTENFPTADELKALGITRVVYLTESRVGENTGLIAADMKPYVEQLQRSGLTIESHGVDPRIGRGAQRQSGIELIPEDVLGGMRTVRMERHGEGGVSMPNSSPVMQEQPKDRGR
ncbi:MAG: hypothetical protein EAY76_04195 [Alphaproteobacteria bacterium]|nr:MAG: hypothetical protein EAY76_04195 [Alphaproteobacteria bacterium]TAF40909.1 MAG: hypothetical protein EAZ66_02190 [Alphaproteobacteria bacterium]TAF76865.1 MAG: hypothetical protein EAZ52_01720 [Alphaproteobacteria bacterium]